MRKRKDSASRSDPLTQHVARRLVERRNALGLVTDHLAALLGVSPSSANRYETGESDLSASTLYRLCIVLDCEPAYFFSGLLAEAPHRLGGVEAPTANPALAAAEIGVRARDAATEDRRAFLSAAEALFSQSYENALKTWMRALDTTAPASDPERVARVCIAATLDPHNRQTLEELAEAHLPPSNRNRRDQK